MPSLPNKATRRKSKCQPKANRKNKANRKKPVRYGSVFHNKYELLEARRLLAADVHLASQVSPLLDQVTSFGTHDFLAGDDEPRRRMVSADGRYVVFQSNSGDLVTNDTNNRTDVFRYDRQTELVELVSVNVSGTSGSLDSFTPVISADGSRVAFASRSTDLVPGGTSGNEIFVRNFATGTTEHVSIELDGLDNSGGSSLDPVISADGNVIAFYSSNPDLTANTTRTSNDLFVRNLSTSTTTLVNVSVSNTSGNGNVASPRFNYSISDDGNVVAFKSSGTNLVSASTSGDNIFVYDVAAGTTTLVSANMAGNGTHAGGGYAREPVISGDGDIVVFESSHQDLVTGQSDGANRPDVFSYKISTDTMTMLSFEQGGTDGTRHAEKPVISRDGSTVAFFSGSFNLVSGITDTNNTDDIFVYQFDDSTATTGTLSVVSVRNDGTATGQSRSFNALVSDDGNTVAFTSFSNNLMPFTTNGRQSVFSRDLTTGVTTLVGSNSTGTDKGNSNVGFAVLSGDGSTVAYESIANDHVSGDFNNRRDIFAGSTSLGSLPEVVSQVLPSKASSTPNRASLFTAISDRKQAISADGRYVVFESTAANIVPGDNNGSFISSLTDIYRYDTVNETVELVSVNRDGTGTGNGASVNGVISADGSKVAFQSTSTDLVNASALGSQIYVRDFNTGITSLVSVTRDGNGNDGSGRFPRISADGSTVVFFSNSDELLADPNFSVSGDQIYARDLASQTTTLVTVNAAGNASPNGGHSFPVVSDDGSVVAFQSTSSNLSALDTDSSTDIYARDLTNANTILVSANFDGDGTGDRHPSDPAISGDGSTVVFQSSSTNLLDPSAFTSDTGTDVYARNLVTGEISLVSVNVLGTGSANSTSQDADINFDGSIVVFESSGTNLIGGVSGNHIYRRNLTSGITDLVSVPVSGNISALDPQVSGDGNIVTFTATGAFLDESSLGSETFVRNMSGETTRLVSMAVDGGGGDMVSGLPIISDDGLTVAFLAKDTNLVENDTNLAQDVFVTTALFEPPTIDAQTFATSEDDFGASPLGTVVATGIESDVTYEITGGDSSLFVIDPDTGELFVAAGAMLDFETAQSHTVDVTVTDDFGLTATAQITIDVTNVNEAPVIPVPGLSDRNVDEDNTLTIPAADLQALLGGQLDEDAGDPNSALTGTLVIVDEDSNVVFSGSIDLVNFSDVNFTPPLNYFGTLTATITVTDSGGLFDTSTFNITVNDINDVPISVNDSDATDEDTSVVIDVLTNDSDVDGTIDPTTVTVTGGPANGSVSVDAVTGAITYTPAANFNGADSFTYTVKDDDGDDGNVATVNLTVNDVNDAPVAADDSTTTDEDTAVVIDILSNDSDIDGTLDPNNIFISGPSNGSVVINSVTGAVTYTPDPEFSGSDSFVYVVLDDDGAFSNSANVAIAVNAQNDAPIADDATFSVDEDDVIGTVVGAVTSSDVDGPAPTYSITAGNIGGAFAIDPASGEITIASALDFETTPGYSLTVEVSDGALSDTATITINVDDVNEAPTVVLDNTLTSIAEDANTTTRIKVADITIADDALGTNNLSLSGDDAAMFEIDGSELFLVAGASLDFETNPALDVTVTVDDGENPTDNDSLSIVVTDVAEAGPRVTGIRVNSTAWDSDFRDFVDGGAAAGTGVGYPIPTGADQLEILPWISINQLLVTFDTDVEDSLDAGDLTLSVISGVRGDGTTASIPVVVTSPFEWDSSSNTATFTLNQSIEPGRLSLQIASADVTDSDGNGLDGEWTNGQSATNSGDGTAGGDFSFQINVLPGDVLRPSDEVVTTDDALEILNNAGLLLNGNPINYDMFLDLNGDTVVNALDTQAAVVRNTSRLLSTPLFKFKNANADFQGSRFDSGSNEGRTLKRRTARLAPVIDHNARH